MKEQERREGEGCEGEMEDEADAANMAKDGGAMRARDGDQESGQEEDAKVWMTHPTQAQEKISLHAHHVTPPADEIRRVTQKTRRPANLSPASTHTHHSALCTHSSRKRTSARLFHCPFRCEDEQ